MFVGHAALAFAVVAGAAVARGWGTERALTVGLVAGAFATLPDVDMVYAVVGIAGTSASGDALALAGAFWSTGNVVHRAVTHSLVLAPPVALLATLRVTDARLARALAIPVAVAVVVAAAAGGPLAAVISLAFVLGGAVLGTVVDQYTDLTAGQAFTAALVGLVTHPFGDLFTGEPPAMLYPLETAFVTDRVALAKEPTLHLLAAFGVELATIWAAVAVVCVATGLRPTAAVSPRASLGAGYAASVVVIPAPTLDFSYPFVFSVLAVGLLGVVPRLRFVGGPRGPTVEPPDWFGAGLTGLSAITVAWLAYTVAYVLVG